MARPASLSVAHRWLLWSEWRAYPGRALAAVLAIALGVALGFAVHLVNASALGEFDKAMHSVSGSADLEIRSANAFGFDEMLYPRVARLPGLDVSPVVALSALVDDKIQVSLEGVDVLRAGGMGQGASDGGAEGLADFLSGRSVYLSAAALSAAGRKVGDSMTLGANGHAIQVRIAGTLPSRANTNAVTMDIAAAQWRFGMLGRLQRLEIRLAPGIGTAGAMRMIRAVLPPDAIVTDTASEAARNDGLSAAYRVNLDMLALIALLTGGFLVYSAQSLSVARRRAQFALLRVLGMQRKKVLGQVLTEASVLGVVGAGAGVALGLGLASLALNLLGGDLGGGYFHGNAPQLVFAPWAAAIFGLLGVGAAVLGSMVPALAASRILPALAIKNAGDAVDPRVRARPWRAVVCLVGALLASLLPAVGGIALFGYVAMALLLAGGVMLMPWLARALVSPLRHVPLRHVPFRLATARLWGAPSQASVALAGIVASTALTVAMAVMVTSFRGSVERWLGDVLQADVYLIAEGGRGGFDAATLERMRKVPGVAWLGVLKETPLQFDARRPAVTLLARTLTGPGGHLALMGSRITVPAGATAVWVSEPASRIYHWKPGDTLTLPLPGSPKARVAGVWRDYARQHGAIVMDEGTYARLTGDRSRTSVSVLLAPGANSDTVVAGLRSAVGPGGGGVTVSRPQDIRRQALEAFDRSFLITYLLEGIAVCVGLAGVAATIGAQVLSRIREFGMLRHVGALRGDLVRMLLIEGALLGLVGGIAGVALGVAMSQVLIHVVNPQSFHWTMDTLLPWPLLGWVIAGLAVATSGTALVVGRSVLSADAVRAVREDW
ncbi:putative ABC transport system permease protein [Luteibacter jiangsuensis]|uniref:ABC transport system permease protein n=1 Tax=Luteibacter jiangsuensis TaxID=637577 RepID=A0ABT9SVM8_9GAMM|nr:ABC transporter permease [Luteibacter jiangsuensis]MDQ0008032.1 putative ABC transport system permease protein [Luteibacter jiangsuensis]